MSSWGYRPAAYKSCNPIDTVTGRGRPCMCSGYSVAQLNLINDYILVFVFCYKLKNHTYTGGDYVPAGDYISLRIFQHPWNTPQTPNQHFMKDFLSGFGDA